MKFARMVFRIAGIWGLLVMAPLYFLFDFIGRQDPPPITHPQFYFGFVGVGLAWQVAFLLIAADPSRFRPMIVPAILEKLTFSCAVAVLYSQGRMTAMQAAASSPDALFFVLFVIAYFKTRPASGGSRPSVPMNVRIP
jgi:hypothetical protein